MNSENNDIYIKKIGLWKFELSTEQYIPCHIDEVFNFYSEAKNLNLITPPFFLGLLPYFSVHLLAIAGSFDHMYFLCFSDLNGISAASAFHHHGEKLL